MAPPPRSPTKVRVLCVDDSEDIAELLGRCLSAEPDLELAGRLDCADALLAEVVRVRADVVLLDMKMPGADPLEAIRQLAAAMRGANGWPGRGRLGGRVIAYSGRDDQAAVDLAMDAGAWGYISKDLDVPAVLEAIREVARGRVAIRVKRPQSPIGVSA